MVSAGWADSFFDFFWCCLLKKRGLVFSSDEGQDDTEACKNVIELASEMPSSPLARIPLNLVPKTDDEEINTYLGLTAVAAASETGV